MFGNFFCNVKRSAEAIAATDKIMELLTPVFLFYYCPEKRLDRKMASDEYVLSYLYGTIGRCIEAFTTNNREVTARAPPIEAHDLPST